MEPAWPFSSIHEVPETPANPWDAASGILSGWGSCNPALPERLCRDFPGFWEEGRTGKRVIPIGGAPQRTRQACRAVECPIPEFRQWEEMEEKEERNGYGHTKQRDELPRKGSSDGKKILEKMCLAHPIQPFLGMWLRSFLALLPDFGIDSSKSHHNIPRVVPFPCLHFSKIPTPPLGSALDHLHGMHKDKVLGCWVWNQNHGNDGIMESFPLENSSHSMVREPCTIPSPIQPIPELFPE